MTKTCDVRVYVVVNHKNQFCGVYGSQDDAREYTADAESHYIIDEVVLYDATIVIEQDD